MSNLRIRKFEISRRRKSKCEYLICILCTRSVTARSDVHEISHTGHMLQCAFPSSLDHTFVVTVLFAVSARVLFTYCGASHRANFIVVVPGANYYLSPEDVTASSEKLKGAKVMVVSRFVLRRRPLAHKPASIDN